MTEVGISNNQSLLLVNIGGFCCTTNYWILDSSIDRPLSGKWFLTNLIFFINTLLMSLFGIYIIAIKNGFIYSAPWIPITILCGINFFGASVIILPWMLLSEVFPNK
ncbi:unnamed protein product [Macrosiphum euphorbiae]|nr:unnamed protein product [Macrosiphum euphorbiae]